MIVSQNRLRALGSYFEAQAQSFYPGLSRHSPNGWVRLGDPQTAETIDISVSSPGRWHNLI